MNFNKEEYRILTENVIRRLIKENVFDGNIDDYEDEEEEISDVEEYEQGYPNSDFDPNNIDKDMLAQFCKTNDFLYVYNTPFRGWKLCNANSSEIQSEIVRDIYNCGYIEPTHEVDYLITSRERDFIHDYICVMKLCQIPNEADYYVVYMRSKYE